MSESETAVLLLSCPDQPGLVAAVSDFVFRNHGNILHADQHTDQEQGIFLQRVEWEMDGFLIPRESLADAFRPIAGKFGMSWDIRLSTARPRVALLVSRQPHCLFDLLARSRMGEFQAEFPLVVSNHPELLSIGRDFGLACHHLPIEEGNKAAQEGALLNLLRDEQIDLVVLARYMQVLGSGIVDAFKNRIINIHHSFLPAFVGARPYHQAHDRGVKIIGATAHYVTADLDQGPIIEQDVVRVSHRDTVHDLILKGRDLEKIVLARAVGLHLANRVIVYGNKTVVFD